jgi:hypothetical protein
MGMEREPGSQGPFWKVTPRLLVVTLAATAVAVAYGLLLWWANPSCDTQFLVNATAPSLGAWIIGLLEPRRFVIGVGLGLLLAAIGLAPSMRHWAWVDIVRDAVTCALVGAGIAAGLSRLRYARASRGVLTVVLCLGLAALVVRAVEDFRLPAMRAVASQDWPIDAALRAVGVSPPAGARWTAGRDDYQWDAGVVFSRTWRADVPSVGRGRWEVRVNAENMGTRRAWRLARFAVSLCWQCSDRATRPIATEGGVPRTVRALVPGLRITKVEARRGAYRLTPEPCGWWEFIRMDWVPAQELIIWARLDPGPTPN